MPLEDYSNRCQQRINQILLSILPDDSTVSKMLIKAMSYSVFNGGKRIRPLLAYAASQCVKGIIENTDPAACATELIHAYSLVHDDLPAMDDDDLRRGKPACHKKFGESIAILAGDALQALAFEVLSSTHILPNAHLSNKQRLQQTQVLSAAIGYGGMVGGQAMDLNSIGLHLPKNKLIQMHSHKTGALIRASVKMGALSQPNIEQWQLKQLDQYATTIGLAFQVQDDILDVMTDTEILGKQQGSDAERNKPTYVSTLGLKEAKQFAASLCQSAISSIADFGSDAKPLQQLANYIVKRTY